MSKIMGREIDIAYDRNPEARFFQDAELTVEFDGSGITDEELAQILGGTILVRCQDCKYMQCNIRQDESLPRGVDEYECRHWCGPCYPTDFCSYGERYDRPHWFADDVMMGGGER